MRMIVYTLYIKQDKSKKGFAIDKYTMHIHIMYSTYRDIHVKLGRVYIPMLHRYTKYGGPT